MSRTDANNQQRAINLLKHKLATAQGMYEAERYRRQRVEAKLDRARTELNDLAQAALDTELAAEAADIAHNTLPDDDTIARLMWDSVSEPDENWAYLTDRANHHQGDYEQIRDMYLRMVATARTALTPNTPPPTKNGARRSEDTDR